MNNYNFGNFVCKLRESKGLTQHDVAVTLGVTPAAVSKWENGSSMPRVEVLFQLAKILDVRAEELVEGRFLTEETIDNETAKRITERYEYLSIIEPYSSTSVKLKRLLSSIIDFLMAAFFTWITTSIVYKLSTIAEVTSVTETAATVLCICFSFVLFLGLHDMIGFGRSLGKRIMGLVVLDKKTGKKSNIKQRLLRNITTTAFILFSPLLLGIDAIIMLIRGQTIGDSLANTVVVKKKQKDKVDYKENTVAKTMEEEGSTEQNNIPPSNVDLQEINAYTAPPHLDKKFANGLLVIIAIISISVFSLIILYFTKYDSYNTVNTDILKYEDDRDTYCNASVFLPQLESLTEYTDISYSHKTMIYSSFMGFASDGLALFVQYDETVYESKKAEILSSYTFLDAPVVDGEYELPVTEFLYKNYQIKIIPDEKYVDYCACQSFAMVGFDDENKRIVYCYHYSFDLDYIAEHDEDPEAEMREFMDDVFEWKNTD